MDTLEIDTPFMKKIVSFFVKNYCKKRFGIDPDISIDKFIVNSDGEKLKIKLDLDAEVPASILTKLALQTK